jgi:serine/threonine protein kinase
MNSCVSCGLYHRDIKTQNILIKLVDNGSVIVYISDFGESKIYISDALVKTGLAKSVVGTPLYIAPEMRV